MSHLKLVSDNKNPVKSQDNLSFVSCTLANDTMLIYADKNLSREEVLTKLKILSVNLLALTGNIALH